MKIQRIDHIEIAVRDLDKATAFFAELLGTQFSPEVVVEQHGLKSAFSPLGLEVFAPTTEDSWVQRLIAKRGEGLFAISFKVDDLEDGIRYFEKCGLQVVARLTTGQLTEAEFHPKDSFGVLIELCEYPDRSATYDAAMDVNDA